MFPEFLFHKPKRKRGAVDRGIYFFKQKRQGACMVFMAMREHYSPNLLFIFNDIRKIRYDKINTKHVFFRKHQAGIYDNYVIFIFDNSHVEAYFLNTAERYDRENFFHC